MTNLIQLLLILFFTSCAISQVVTPVPFTESRKTVRAFMSPGEVILPALCRQIDIHYQGGKKERGSIVIVYDPSTGHYLWRYDAFHRPEDTSGFWEEFNEGRAAIYAGDAALVEVNMPSILYVKAHTERASSMDAADRESMMEVQRGLHAMETGAIPPGWNEISIFKSVGIEFGCAPFGDPDFTQMCGFAAKSIPAISKVGQYWRIVVRNRWDQEVILDRDFKFVSTRRLP